MFLALNNDNSFELASRPITIGVTVFALTVRFERREFRLRIQVHAERIETPVRSFFLLKQEFRCRPSIRFLRNIESEYECLKRITA